MTKQGGMDCENNGHNLFESVLAISRKSEIKKLKPTRTMESENAPGQNPRIIRLIRSTTVTNRYNIQDCLGPVGNLTNNYNVGKVHDLPVLCELSSASPRMQMSQHSDNLKSNHSKI